MNFNKININFFRDIIFPARCCVCNCLSDTYGICAVCWSKIPWISEPKCKICGLPFTVEFDGICADCQNNPPYFDRAISVMSYSNELSRSMILKMKNADETALAEPLACLMYKVAAFEIESSDVIITVPIHFFKRLKRKYNQSELLAQEICKLSNIKYEPRFLKKITQTHAQEGLSREERQKNIIGSFGVDNKYLNSIENKKVILVDDVLTTGATVNECSRILKEYGAKKIVVVTIARVPK